MNDKIIFNTIYDSGMFHYGIKPSPLLEKIVRQFFQRPINGCYLDLGSGIGSNALFMAQCGFNTVAVDFSRVALGNLKKKANELDLSDMIKVVYSDLAAFQIKENSYSVISCVNALQFLEKENSLRLVRGMKEGLVSGGIIFIVAFTDEKKLSVFQSPTKPFKEVRPKTYFKNYEALEMFSGFIVVDYFEGIVLDSGLGKCSSHYHGIVRIVAQRPN